MLSQTPSFLGDRVHLNKQRTTLQEGIFHAHRMPDVMGESGKRVEIASGNVGGPESRTAE